MNKIGRCDGFELNFNGTSLVPGEHCRQKAVETRKVVVFGPLGFPDVKEVKINLCTECRGYEDIARERGNQFAIPRGLKWSTKGDTK